MEASASVAAGRLPDEEGVAPALVLARRVERRLHVAMGLANWAGAVDLFVLLFWVLPAPEHAAGVDHLTPNLIALAIYAPLACAMGTWLGIRMSPARYPWIREGRPPTEGERLSALQAPMRLLRICGVAWLGGLVLFTAINASLGADMALHVAGTIALGSVTTCAVCYLLAERIMRPVTALALAGGPPTRPIGPGVEGRVLLAWATASGVPIVGILMLGAHAAFDPAVTNEEIGLGVLVLGGAALALGLGVMFVAARTVSTPLQSVRRALARVQAGDLSAMVRVNDASEVGLLQSGFNSMVSGLRERERMEELLSSQVGEDVMREALQDDPKLGGEVCDIAVMFIDIVGSTAYALQAPPQHVVARLNRFFAVVVDVVGTHGGWVNKFQGDAAMCLFGAPAPLDDPAACALAAARELQERLHEQMPTTEAGVGLSAGPAVAGWVGAPRRFEYTVIGDPVNEAARLCELAKTRPGRVLASEAIVARAGRDEGLRWRLGEATVLRGRSTPTRLAAPA